MAETDYPQPEDPKITFGRKGELNNPALLGLIEKQEPLKPAALFKLARFFNNSLLNASLGEGLEVSALATIVAAPDLQEPIQQLFAVNGNEAKDQAEDNFPHEWPPTYDEGRSDDVGSGATRRVDGLSFIFVPLFDDGNSGLLIKPQDTETGEMLYFIVGVCPDPNKLSFRSARGRARHAR